MAVLRPADAPDEPHHAVAGTSTRRNYSAAGGLTQFGAYLETLAPGARTSDRHWHEVEDEFLLMISGEATVIEDDGSHVIGPGDAACWPGGVANAHTVENRSDAPCSFLILGTKQKQDRCHYPDLGRTQIDDWPDWSIVDDATGQVLKEGRQQ